MKLCTVTRILLPLQRGSEASKTPSPDNDVALAVTTAVFGALVLVGCIALFVPTLRAKLAACRVRTAAARLGRTRRGRLVVHIIKCAFS